MRMINRYSPYGLPHNEPDTITIHAMSEYLQLDDGRWVGAREFLDTVKLSAHVLVMPDGDMLKMRDDYSGAYHAKGYNVNSLGAEVVVAGKHSYGSFLKAIDEAGWVTDAQYQALVWQCKVWLAKHDIKRVVRHSDLSPGRKYDPGAGFPWEQFLIDIGWVK